MTKDAPDALWDAEGEDMIPRPRCATCRWWNHDPQLVGEVYGEHEGDCRYLTQLQSERIDSIAEDVCTPSDFGCIQWERREEGGDDAG